MGCVSPRTIDKGLASAASFQCHGCSLLTISGEESAAACARHQGRLGCELNSQNGQNFHWAAAELGSEIRATEPAAFFLMLTLIPGSGSRKRGFNQAPVFSSRDLPRSVSRVSFPYWWARQMPAELCPTSARVSEGKTQHFSACVAESRVRLSVCSL